MDNNELTPKAGILTYVLEINVNDDYNEYTCKYDGCRTICTTRSEMIAHIGTHVEFNWDHVYRCNHCQINFTRKYELELHLRKHSGEKVHKCAYCEKTFTREVNLKKHVVRIHERDRSVKCFVCEKIFKSAFQLNIHLGIHVLMKEHLK